MTNASWPVPPSPPAAGTGRSLLVLGGVRSGKSRYAQMQAEAAGGRLIYLATAEGADDEMRARIARHRSDRDARWQTVEAPLDLAGALHRHATCHTSILVDCLTLWLSNTFLAGRDVSVRLEELADAISLCPGHLTLVSNEVGYGIVPTNRMAREYRDWSGLMNQRVAQEMTSVHLVVAGVPLVFR